jgi:hypothetical protein
VLCEINIIVVNCRLKVLCLHHRCPLERGPANRPEKVSSYRKPELVTHHSVTYLLPLLHTQTNNRKQVQPEVTGAQQGKVARGEWRVSEKEKGQVDLKPNIFISFRLRSKQTASLPNKIQLTQSVKILHVEHFIP